LQTTNTLMTISIHTTDHAPILHQHKKPVSVTQQYD